MKTCNFSLRRARLDDDICAIAKYIYLTDPYIYPSIADNYESKDWISIVSQCYRMNDNLFYYKNIFVAIADERIIGICCIIPNKKHLEFNKRLNLSDALTQKIKGVVAGYFEPLLNESLDLEGYSVVNLCIDPMLRGLGFGKKLLEYAMKEVQSKVFYLDVIADNVSAICVYKSLLFEIEKEYYGFLNETSSILCYRMKGTLNSSI